MDTTSLNPIEDKPTLKPEQLSALKQHITTAARQMAENPDQTDPELGSVIFMGNTHDAYPRDLITDPILKSDEIHAWMLIRLGVTDQYQITRIPRQSSLQNQLKLSRPVVSRILQVLRALRWITLCTGGSHDHFQGTVYAQHDIPLSLAETLELDPGYIDFLEEEVKGDALKRANTIKLHVLKHANYQLMTDMEVLKPKTGLDSFETRFNSRHNPDPLKTHLACPPEVVEPHNTTNTYINENIPKAVQDILSQNKAENDHVNNIYMVKNSFSGRFSDKPSKNTELTENNGEINKFNSLDHVNNIDMVTLSSSCCSSSLIKKTTTTKNTGPKLRIADCFSQSHKTIRYATDLARSLPDDEQQFALDFVEDRVKAGKAGATSLVSNPIGMLMKIVDSIKAGTFQPTSYGFRPSESVKQNTLKDTGSQLKEIEAQIRHLDMMIEKETVEQLKQNLLTQRAEAKASLDALRSPGGEV